MVVRFSKRHKQRVAPLAGARIEIDEEDETYIVGSSLPSRERGLKFPIVLAAYQSIDQRRSPRGSED